MIQTQNDVFANYSLLLSKLAATVADRGARKVMGQNLDVVWGEFSTLS